MDLNNVEDLRDRLIDQRFHNTEIDESFTVVGVTGAGLMARVTHERQRSNQIPSLAYRFSLTFEPSLRNRAGRIVTPSPHSAEESDSIETALAAVALNDAVIGVPGSSANRSELAFVMSA